MKYIGIDGCKSGWFYVSLDENDKFSFGVISDISEIKNEINNAEQALIDIPIGLRETDTRERLCDLEARKVLGPLRSSVFPPPSRLALVFDDYNQASQINFQCTGRRLSKQSFAIMKKINEVDEFIRNFGMQNKIREMHPEICFWALNGNRPMEYNKKKVKGIRERTLLLKQQYDRTEELISDAKKSFLRKDLAIDDIIDAIVGAVSLKYCINFWQLPNEPETDDKGLKMEIVYPAI